MNTTVVVGRIGRAHGIKGEVSVEPRTDEPERRFAVGNVLAGRGSDGVVRSYTVTGMRWHSGRLLLRFADVADRTRAEVIRGTLLEVDVDATEPPADPDEYYDHQLVGLRVETASGREIGTIDTIVHGPLQDLLVIKTDDGEAMVPFVEALVPTVDVAAGLVVVIEQPGLLEL